MSNCPEPGCTVEGKGMRLSWGCAWAETKGGRKDIRIRKAHPCRILTNHLGCVSRPILREMVNAHYFYCLILNPVNNDVGKARENRFARAFDPSLATSAWKASQVPQPSYRDSATSAALADCLVEC